MDEHVAHPADEAVSKAADRVRPSVSNQPTISLKVGSVVVIWDVIIWVAVPCVVV